MPFWVHDRTLAGGTPKPSILRQSDYDNAPDVLSCAGHPVIVLHQEVCAEVDDVNDGNYLYVKVALGEGWLARKYVAWVSGSIWYKNLRDATWWDVPWSISASSLHVWCTHSTRVVDPDSIGLTADVCEATFDPYGYTYVALYVGLPFSRDRRVQVCRECHITLSYAAAMYPDDLTKLQRKLEWLLTQWLHLKPCVRPQQLIPFRTARVFGVGTLPQHIFRKVRLVDCSEHDIKEWHQSNQIEPSPHHPEASLSLNEWLRIRSRDRNRLHEARDRVPALMANISWSTFPVTELEVDTPKAGFGRLEDEPLASLQMHDLCWYLQDAIKHFPPASFHPLPDKGVEMRPPYNNSPCNLHISRQGHWVRHLRNLPEDIWF